METLTYNDLPQAIQTLDTRLDRIEEILKNQAQPEPDRLLTLPELAELLDLAAPTIYGLVSRREIPHTKKGKRLYFLKSEIDAWLSQGRRKTIDEMKAEIT